MRASNLKNSISQIRLALFDKDIAQKIEITFWRTITIVLLSVTILCVVTLMYKTASYATSLEEASKKTTVVVVPGATSQMVVQANNVAPLSYGQERAIDIVNFLEFWSYHTIEGRIETLDRYYLAKGASEYIKQNILRPDVLEWIKTNKAISQVVIDYDNIKTEWNDKIQRFIVLIPAERRVWVKDSVPYANQKIAYLIWGLFALADTKDPVAFKATRIILDDTSEDPSSKLMPLLEDAKKSTSINSAEVR